MISIVILTGSLILVGVGLGAVAYFSFMDGFQAGKEVGELSGIMHATKTLHDIMHANETIELRLEDIIQ